MMARKPFVINSMIVMPIPSQNKINPNRRFTIHRHLSIFLPDMNLFYFMQNMYKCDNF